MDLNVHQYVKILAVVDVFVVKLIYPRNRVIAHILHTFYQEIGILSCMENYLSYLLLIVHLRNNNPWKAVVNVMQTIVWGTRSF